MKKRIVSLILTLCFLLSVFALASCGKSDAPADATTAAVTEPSATEPAASGIGRAQETGALVFK